ncbi:hypothetical protein BOTBODRAFT_517258 [Botryobasidium botryosum FD-172 SS1]|uniref:Uncharacterized protein n=1 Tax=Botryobasidium botryosum (strain FD-172 SS1) TaxID=930990 RepID=A0A067MVA8_BOTB1|nr:hypothetical protein BOTBODRAFT_517258 [Botryobasidium botryosum FD-172 SS1]
MAGNDSALTQVDGGRTTNDADDKEDLVSPTWLLPSSFRGSLSPACARFPTSVTGNHGTTKSLGLLLKTHYRPNACFYLCHLFGGR